MIVRIAGQGWLALLGGGEFSYGETFDADEAWDLSAGAAQVVVGELDSGTDIDHVDLVENLWKNAGETPGNNQDDDGNGFVDDYDGWNFEAGNGNPRSTNGHGTNVAGIVAASALLRVSKFMKTLLGWSKAMAGTLLAIAAAKTSFPAHAIVGGAEDRGPLAPVKSTSCRRASRHRPE